MLVDAALNKTARSRAPAPRRSRARILAGIGGFQIEDAPVDIADPARLTAHGYHSCSFAALLFQGGILVAERLTLRSARQQPVSMLVAPNVALGEVNALDHPASFVAAVSDPAASPPLQVMLYRHPSTASP
jgi:hypothetical protein